MAPSNSRPEAYEATLAEAVNEVDEIKTSLLLAIEAKDPEAFELALTRAYTVGLPRELADVFIDALSLTWHTRHEDLVSALQEFKNPAAIETLATTAILRLPYLDYDELFGLARKCTWALADIGTPLAHQKLAELAVNPNSTIAAYAKKRLDRWETELPRKGY